MTFIASQLNEIKKAQNIKALCINHSNGVLLN